MTLPTLLDWQPTAVYAALATFVLTLLLRISLSRDAQSRRLSVGILAVASTACSQESPHAPRLSRLTTGLSLDRQQVVVGDAHIPLALDGHFWANARITGVKPRMLVNSGVKLTGLSQKPAQRAGVKGSGALGGVRIKTASGVAIAQVGTVDEIKVGSISVQRMSVVTTPALGKSMCSR